VVDQEEYFHEKASRFLMEQRGQKQEGFSDLRPAAPYFGYSEGRRGVSRDIAQKPARRFNISVALFL
jgi:hypothetical protein